MVSNSKRKRADPVDEHSESQEEEILLAPTKKKGKSSKASVKKTKVNSGMPSRVVSSPSNIDLTQSSVKAPSEDLYDLSDPEQREEDDLPEQSEDDGIEEEVTEKNKSMLHKEARGRKKSAEKICRIKSQFVESTNSNSER